MKRAAAVVAIVLSAGLAFGAEAWRNGERVALWPSEQAIPDFQPHQFGAMTDETYIGSPWQKNPKLNPDFKVEEHRMPYLEWFEAPAKPNGGCMILVSGGSYTRCCDVALIKEWKERFTELGFQTVNLVYRTPRPRDAEFYRSGWQDGQRAVRMVRAAAAKRGFDAEKIGVIGMSAGGHLVTMLATSALTPAYARVDELDDLPCHVNWCIADAPAYNAAASGKGESSLFDGLTKPGSPVAACFRFDAKTCPMSFHHGGLDPYSPNGSAQCYRELRKRNIPAEVHFYSDKGHGAFGLERAVEFINQMNFVGTLRPGELLLQRYASDAARGTYEKMNVWPDGKTPNLQTNQCTPYLEWHTPKNRRTRAIQIVYSGGAYVGNSNEGFEVAPIRRYLNEKGMTVVTMKYRVPRPAGLAKHVTAWQDLQRTIRIVRSEALARGLDPNRIGIMGCSAGGHLTLMGACSSTVRAYEPIDKLDELPCNVQWAIPVYPAYALTDGSENCNVHRGNLDEDVLVEEFAFDALTPPMCFLHGDADAWSAMNSVKCWERLRLMNVQCDLHTLATRGHTFMKDAAPETGSYTWMDRIWEFLTTKNFNR